MHEAFVPPRLPRMEHRSESIETEVCTRKPRNQKEVVVVRLPNCQETQSSHTMLICGEEPTIQRNKKQFPQVLRIILSFVEEDNLWSLGTICLT